MALAHLRPEGARPERVVILGSDGFVGGALQQRLQKSGTPTLPIASHEIDMRRPEAAAALGSKLQGEDALFMNLALPPVKTAVLLADHLAIIRTIIATLAARPVAHVVSLGTDAVYADEPVPLTEASLMAPSEIHGAAFLAREIALRSEVKAPLAFLRATLIYGAADTYNGYGPNRFRRLAAEGREIVLGGEGEERRDHIFIGDVTDLVERALVRRSTGSLNLASGELATFRRAAELAVATSGHKVPIKGSPRTGQMAHNGYRPFDVTAIARAFPDFRPTPLADGIALAAQGY